MRYVLGRLEPVVRSNSNEVKGIARNCPASAFHLYKREIMMKWSKYNILTKSEKYGHLLFNTMSMVFIQIPDADYRMWEHLKNNPEKIDELPQKDFLINSRIFVEDDNDDLNVYLADVLKNRYNSSDMALTILPTRGCNFGCIYCYEKERPMVNMDEKTEDAIVNFVKRNPNLKRLAVVWYGGEPLVNFPSIRRLSEAFLNMDIGYSAKMVCNGYLLTRHIADEIEKLKIGNIQITLDGTKEVHDKRRPLLGGGPTFDRIMENLQYLLSINKTVTVDIRSNIDRRNMEQYHDFYSYFKQEIPDSRVTLYPGFVSDLLSEGCVSPENNISEGGYKARFALDVFHKYGIEIKAFLPKFRRHSCVASKYFAFVIGPEGEIYKCWKMVGNKGQTLGNVRGGIDLAKFSRYLVGADYTRDARCLECEFITLCGGGCPLVRLRNKEEHLSLNHCCPEKSHMEQLMEMRYEMTLMKRNGHGTHESQN